MKLAVISDIHANLEALRATLGDIAAIGVDKIVCLGDVVGYNADPADCIDLVRDSGALCVAGNHDRAVTGQIATTGFNPIAERAVAWTRDRLGSDQLDFLAGLPLKATVENRLLMVHGALHPEVGCELVRLDTDEKRRASFDALLAHPSGARICAFGHTHRVGIFELRDGLMTGHTGDEVPIREGSYYLVNPGTVGQPRTADRRATYLVVDMARRFICVRRIKYNAAATLSKTRKAGLAPRLSRLPIPMQRIVRRIHRAVTRK